jgi:hypothetical protein
MLKPTIVMFTMLTACALDTDDPTSTRSSATTTDCQCHDDCDCECPPPPPEPGPSCTDNGVLVDLDSAPANVDDDDGKVTYCHATSSATNPYVVITTSVNACFAHTTHEHLMKGGHLDIFPTGGCAD